MKKISKEPKVYTYIRVGNIEQMDYLIKEEINDPNVQDIVGLYIRSGNMSDMELREDIQKQEQQLDAFCKENKIKNKIKYIDIKKSSNSDERPAFNKMKEDLKNGKINEIVVTSASKLYRNAIKSKEFYDYCKSKNVGVFPIDMDDYIDNFVYDWQDIQNKTQEIENELEV